VLRVYRDIGVVTLIGEEWGYSSSSARGVIVCEFGEWKEFGPIVLLIVAIDADILFKGLIGPLGLTIAFRMITGGEVKAHV